MKKTVLFLLPFGKGMGVGHAVRQSVTARELRRRGYETILWSSGAFEEIAPNLVAEMRECFSQILRPGAVIDDVSQFPSVSAVKELQKIENLREVIIDDYRQVGKPARLQTLRALRKLAQEGGAKIIMVDGVRGLEFNEADVIWNMELGLDATQYSSEEKKKMIRGLQYALLRPSTLMPEKIAELLPENSFFVMIGGTDPRNSAQKILEGMQGIPYNPILVAMKSAKPEDAAKVARLQSALDKFPHSAWLSNLTAGQMCSLWRHVKFAIVGPGSSPCAEAFYNRCPIIGAFTNPSLEANVNALDAIGMPTLRARNHAALMQSWEDASSTLETDFAPEDIQNAVKKLESLGYIKNRLPESAPFNEVDGKGAARIVDALGLYAEATAGV